jgi:2-hydroxychromene-2-carboxylate isomerase
MTTFEIAAEQPYIHRLTRLGAAAQIEGRSLEFAEAIAPVLWDGSTDGWNEGDHLARAASRAGFDLHTLDAAITADPGRYEAIIATNEKDHAASEHWGVPTFTFDGEPFFGQDRIDHLIWRLLGKGMARRREFDP